MCEYCEPIEYDEATGKLQTRPLWKYQNSSLSNLQTIWIDSKDKTLNSAEEDSTLEYYGYADTQINYCPMCGRKL